ncbi:MAG TPA: hypothetical protein VNI77_04445 [Nitrososphaera sp.]|nr:hypothetical protein [Nitrososphaera sp.]
MGDHFGIRKKTLLIIMGSLAVAAIVIAATVAVTFQQFQRTISDESAPRVAFVKFEIERQDLQVGQNTTFTFNVENSEGRVIDDASVSIEVRPEAGNNYLSISNKTIDLPVLYTNARSGEIKVTITATGTPAREAVYDITSTLLAGGSRADVRQFEIKIRQ